MTTATMATRDEVIEAANKMALFLQEEEFGAKFRAKVGEAGILFANQLFESLEEEQIEAIDSWNMNHKGGKMLGHLKMAIRSFPADEGVKVAVMNLVGAEEKLLDVIQGELANKHGLPQGKDTDFKAPGGAGAHGHSHNGVPCGGHGHSHGGQPQMNQQQMASMQMAMQTLSPLQKTQMEMIQKKMMSGQQPTPDDQTKMKGIQQHLMAYMSTMQNAVQNATKAQGEIKK